MSYVQPIIGNKVNTDTLTQKEKDLISTTVGEKKTRKINVKKIKNVIQNLTNQEKESLSLYTIKYIVDNFKEKKSVGKLKKILFDKFYFLNNTEKNHLKALDKIKDNRQKILFLFYASETEKTDDIIDKLRDLDMVSIPSSDKINLFSKIFVSFSSESSQDLAKIVESFKLGDLSPKELLELMNAIKSNGFAVTEKLAEHLDKFPIDKLSQEEKFDLLISITEHGRNSCQKMLKHRTLFQNLDKSRQFELAQRLLNKGEYVIESFLKDYELLKIIQEFSPNERFALARKIIQSSEANATDFISKIENFKLDGMEPTQCLELATFLSDQGSIIISKLYKNLESFQLSKDSENEILGKIDPANFAASFMKLENDPRIADMKARKDHLGNRSAENVKHRLELPEKLKNLYNAKANKEDLNYLESVVSSYFSKRAKTKADVAEVLIDEIKKQLRIRDVSKLKLVFGTHVVPDGSGDYFNTLTLVKGIKDVYPNINVQVFYVYSRALPKVDYKSYNLKDEDVIGFRANLGTDGKSTFSTRNDFATLASVAKIVKANSFEKNDSAKHNPANVTHLDRAVDLAKFITESDMAFHVSVPVDDERNVYSDLIRNDVPHYKYGEYRKRGTMGPTGAGLHRIKPEISQDFQNKNVAEIFKLCGENKPHFCYMRTPHSFIEYAVFQDYWKGKREVNILNLANISDTTLFAKNLENKNIPISKIVLIDGDLRESVTVNNPDQKDGMTLRIYQGGRMAHSDFIKAMDQSGPIVGCTGDVSFTEAVALKKIPFYEKIGTKGGMFKGVLDAAKHFELNDLYNLLKLFPSGSDLHLDVNDNLSRLQSFLEKNKIKKADINLEKAQEQMKSLSDFYNQYYSINDVAIRDINQAYLEKNHDQAVKKIEEELVKTFNEGKMSAEELHNTYLEKLKQLEDLEVF